MYQWAHAVLRKLWGLTFSAKALEFYRTTLERFRPDDIDNPYCETLRGIQDDATITTADKNMIVNLLRVVVVVEMDLNTNPKSMLLPAYTSILGARGSDPAFQ